MEYKENKKIIEEEKFVLKRLREFYREREYLLEEYNDEPAPRSPNYKEMKGASLSQVTKMNDYAWKRELIQYKINILTEIINDFVTKTLLLPTRQRQILEVYMSAKSYQEMVEELQEKYYISISTYKRELPNICLTMYQYIRLEDIPTIEDINQRFLQSI